MYQVLFVEDELLVRLGLQNAIDWKMYEMEITAQADNGLDAYELFLKFRPEVVITDIRMKGMDGYELIRKVRQVDKKCAILVISCLDDFESLRKMMGYNISGYILKASMTMEEINCELEKVKNYLDTVLPGGRKTNGQRKNLEQILERYLLENEEIEWKNMRWKDGKLFVPGQIRSMVIFGIASVDRGKISELGRKFVYEIAEKYLERSVAVDVGEDKFCVFSEVNSDELEKRINKIRKAIHAYLGVEFLSVKEKKDDAETDRQNLKKRFQKLMEEARFISAPEESVISKAIRYMEEHYGETLGLSELSGKLGISASYFSHLFKRETGKNYVEYLNEIRLEQVLKELKETDMKISVIAEENGFNNLEYFSRFFKKSMGVSPRQWREMNQ